MEPVLFHFSLWAPIVFDLHVWLPGPVSRLKSLGPRDLEHSGSLFWTQEKHRELNRCQTIGDPSCPSYPPSGRRGETFKSQGETGKHEEQGVCEM